MLKSTIRTPRLKFHAEIRNIFGVIHLRSKTGHAMYAYALGTQGNSVSLRRKLDIILSKNFLPHLCFGKYKMILWLHPPPTFFNCPAYGITTFSCKLVDFSVPHRGYPRLQHPPLRLVAGTRSLPLFFLHKNSNAHPPRRPCRACELTAYMGVDRASSRAGERGIFEGKINTVER